MSSLLNQNVVYARVFPTFTGETEMRQSNLWTVVGIGWCRVQSRKIRGAGVPRSGGLSAVRYVDAIDPTVHPRSIAVNNSGCARLPQRSGTSRVSGGTCITYM